MFTGMRRVLSSFHQLMVELNFTLSRLTSKRYFANLSLKINLDRDLFFPEMCTLHGGRFDTLTEAWRMQMFAWEGALGSLRVQSGRGSYLKGISVEWKYHTEVSADHNIWHLQNGMLYLKALWKPLFQTKPHFQIRFFFLLGAAEQIAPSLVITLYFSPPYIPNG